VAVKLNKKDDGTFYMALSDFTKYFAHVDIGIFNPEFVYSSWNVVIERKHALYFAITIRQAGEYYFTVVQQSERANKIKFKNYECSQVRILIGRMR
jgi:hypothetical protein